jgi:hypothetical protein
MCDVHFVQCIDWSPLPSLCRWQCHQATPCVKVSAILTHIHPEVAFPHDSTVAHLPGVAVTAVHLQVIDPHLTSDATTECYA